MDKLLNIKPSLLFKIIYNNKILIIMGYFYL